MVRLRRLTFVLSLWAVVCLLCTAPSQAIVVSGSGGLPVTVDCDDSNGQHLNFDITTGQFTCGSSTMPAQTVSIPHDTATTIVNVALGSNTTSSVVLWYKAEVWNNVDLQTEVGLVTCRATNKNGAIANNQCTKVANLPPAVTSGTLVVEWTETAANPSLIQAKVTSSLTPASGWPKVTYGLLDGTSGMGGAPGNAQADGVTKGLVAFLAAEFDCTSGVCQLDYTNAQKATDSVPGLLSAADHALFSGSRVPTSRTLNAGFGIQTIGDLTQDRTVAVQAPAADDQVWVSDSTTGATWKTMPNCTDVSGQHVNYNSGTNTFSCGTSTSLGGDAAADSVTKGVSTFLAADFDASSGLISIDWTNTQKASGAQPGALTAADWTTFNSKANGTLTLTAGFGMQAIGDLSTNRTVAMIAPAGDDQLYVSDSSSAATWRTIPNCTDSAGQHLNYTQSSNSFTCGSSLATIPDAAADGSTKGIAAFTAADFNASSGVISLDYTNGQKATGSVPGFLAATDFAAFAAKVDGTLVLTAGFGMQTIGNLTTGRTIAMVAPSGDDQVYVSSSTSAAAWKSIPDCTDAGGNHINYTAATNTWSCGTSAAGGSPGNGAADGTTKGIVGFVAADFSDNGSGIISLDYTNAQKATGSVPGLLAAADFASFAAKVDGTRTLSNGFGIQAIGNLTQDRTVAMVQPSAASQVYVSDSTSGATWRDIPNCTDTGGSHLNFNTSTRTWSCGSSSSGGVPGDAAADGTTKGIATFAANDFNATGGVVSLDYTNGQAASSSTKGYLSSSDWTAFNAKVSSSLTLTAGFGMQAIGDLSTNRTVAMAQPASDDQVYVSSSSSAAAWKSIPDCTDAGGQHLNYTASTNSFSCGTTSNATVASVTSPVVYGGTGTSSTLSLVSTSGVGATGADVFIKTGNNGATTVASFLNGGDVGIGVSPSARLHIMGPSADVRTTGSAANQLLKHSFYDNNSTAIGEVTYFGNAGAGSKYFGIQSLAADGVIVNAVNDVPVKFATNNTTRFSVSSSLSAIGLTSVTNPALRVNYPAGQVTGVDITGAAAGTAPVIASISSGTDESLELNAKGAGGLRLLMAGTGNMVIGGETARTVGMQRRTGSSNPGLGMTIDAGGSAAGSTDKSGGDLVLKPGVTTGTGRDLVRTQCYKPAFSTGTSDNTSSLVDCVIEGGVISVANNTQTTLASLTLANNSVAAVEIAYSVEVKNASNVQQIEHGRVRCHAIQSGGSIASGTARCSKFSNESDVSDGSSTLSVVWSITNASPALVQINANSSLSSITTGYPRVHMTQVLNMGAQAIAMQ